MAPITSRIVVRLGMEAEDWVTPSRSSAIPTRATAPRSLQDRPTTKPAIKRYIQPTHVEISPNHRTLQQNYPTQNPHQNPPPHYGYSSQGHGAGPQQYQQPNYQGQPPKDDKVHGFLGKIQGTVTDLGSEVAQRLGTAIDPQAYAQYGPSKPGTEHRFGSFAPSRENNDVKWYVDGCTYFWAVSRALENARESIWILDCRFRLFRITTLNVDLILMQGGCLLNST